MWNQSSTFCQVECTLNRSSFGAIAANVVGHANLLCLGAIVREVWSIELLLLEKVKMMTLAFPICFLHSSSCSCISSDHSGLGAENRKK